MRRLLILAASLAFTMASFAQNGAITTPTTSIGQPSNGPGDIAGLIYAANFAHWTLSPGPEGTNHWDNAAQCYGTSGGITFPLFAVGNPVTINDIGTPANTETVTAGAVQYGTWGCSVSLPATHPHYNYYLSSGTAGLQEALNWISGANAAVVLTPDWVTLGGTTAMITAAKAGANTVLFDRRTATIATYSVTAGAFVLATQNAAIITSTAGVPSANCTVGSLDVNTSASSTSTVLYVCYPANTWTAITVP
jgi:hypothetical protein